MYFTSCSHVLTSNTNLGNIVIWRISSLIYMLSELDQNQYKRYIAFGPKYTKFPCEFSWKDSFAKYSVLLN